MAILLTKELLSKEPENLARELCENGNDTSTQIRKFYNDFLILKAKADISQTEDDFKKNVLPLICFAKAKIAYALGRDGVQISKRFAEEINRKVDLIETRSDFENFLNYYQALIGYVKFYDRQKKDERQNNRRNQNINNNNGQRNFQQGQPRVFVDRRNNNR